MARAAGLLLHPTSLPGPCGVGDLGPAAMSFLDWAGAAGQGVWQVLPLGPTGHGDSPYNALSAFAGNPLLVSPELLCDEGLLTAGEIDPRPPFARDRVEVERVRAWKAQLVRIAWERWKRWADRDARQRLAAFAEDPAQQPWLDDWALFSALKERFGGAAWCDWPAPLRLRDEEALAAARAELADELDHHRFVQYLFHRQWDGVRLAARERGISVIGDMPFYVALDSADVWSRRRLFELDERGEPVAVAGVPPDYFSPTGQLWGNPIYRWAEHREEDFAWWTARLAANLRLADAVRVDHFRGFRAYWSVPAGERTAVQGRWLRSPGEELFAAARRDLGRLPLIAEDLGLITPAVEALRDGLALPGIRVLQFAFGGDDSNHLPHRHRRRAVVYTGTHDNDTTVGWFAGLGREERERVLDYLGATRATIAWDLVRSAYCSVCELALVPLQDVLALGSEARMNEPGRAAGNWTWRALPEQFLGSVAVRLRRLAEITGRVPAAARQAEETEEQQRAAAALRAVEEPQEEGYAPGAGAPYSGSTVSLPAQDPRLPTRVTDH